MKKHLYVFLGISIGLPPLLLSFDEKVNFIAQFPYYAISALIVGAIYICWDVIVTKRGDWKFNPEYTGNFRLFRLPLGEWIFFISVPYACLFIYEVIRSYFQTIQFIHIPIWVSITIAVIFFFFAILNLKKSYSFLALISVGVFFILQGILDQYLIGRSDFLIYMGLGFTAFIIVNGIYTSLPTIYYHKDAIFGIKFFSIPIEDFLYNLSLLGLYALFFDLSKRILL